MKNNRTFLEKLLDGAEVEWKSLGKVTDIKTGQSVSKNIIAQNSGIYPVINSGREPLGFINEWNTENDPIGITTRGAGVGSITWQEGKYFRGNLNYSVTIKSEYELNVRFLYHVLLHFQKEIHNLCSFTGIPALNASELKKLEIPIPPLSVQTEIVKILDALTALTCELTCELILRQKQYEYYREKLLSEEELGKVGFEWRALKDILIRTKGTKITAAEMKVLHKENAPLKIFAGGKTFALVNYSDIPEKDINKNPSIIVKSRGIIEFEYYDKPFSHKNEMWSYYSNDKNINIKYIYYVLKNQEPYFQSLGSKMQMPQIAIPDTDKYLVPIPPPYIQTEIVKVLDKFVNLTNSISEGLPLAIEQSQKRYEYYKELLLSFS
ncbi:restriction endonuclease subunit S [Haemophilus influenzae]|nr:restriction endonuclease subunit S [Haemophilus influenzae]